MSDGPAGVIKSCIMHTWGWGGHDKLGVPGDLGHLYPHVVDGFLGRELCLLVPGVVLLVSECSCC